MLCLRIIQYITNKFLVLHCSYIGIEYVIRTLKNQIRDESTSK